MSTDRFAGILPQDMLQWVSCFIVGCGGIGGYTASLLNKMGINNMVLIDHDEVEEANIGTQIYRSLDVAPDTTPNYKVDRLRSYLDGNIRSRCVKYDKSQFDMIFSPRTIIISAVDNIETRRAMWEEVNEWGHNRDILFIDPRMTLEFLEVNALPCNPLDTNEVLYATAREDYCTRIHDLETPYDEAPCGAQGLPGTGMFAASMIASIALRWIRKEPYPYLTLGTLGCDVAKDMTVNGPYISAYYPVADKEKTDEIPNP